MLQSRLLQVLGLHSTLQPKDTGVLKAHRQKKYYMNSSLLLTMHGNPKPDIEFSKDASDGAWGSKKVQVNLCDPDEKYTLTATAINSEGSASNSIESSWGCEILEEESATTDTSVMSYL
jgi:hypothetical protein